MDRDTPKLTVIALNGPRSSNARAPERSRGPVQRSASIQIGRGSAHWIVAKARDVDLCTGKQVGRRLVGKRERWISFDAMRRVGESIRPFARRLHEHGFPYLQTEVLTGFVVALRDGILDT
jgi:hypothetical protein